MTFQTNPAPDEVLPDEDTGAKTLERYEFQSLYCALLAVGILDTKTDIDEIFCEQHEDVLIKLKDGQFDAAQVKTKDIGYEPFKAGDEKKIIPALKRFIELDGKFPKRFRKFQIVSNIGFWKEKKNGSNIYHVIELAKKAKNDGGTLDTVLKTLLKKIEKDAAKWPAILEVLVRVEPITTANSVRDLVSRVEKSVRALNLLQDKTLDILQVVTQNLKREIFDRSTYRQDETVEDYISYVDGSTARQSIIEKRKVCAELVNKILEDGSEIVVQYANLIPIERLPKGISKTEKKLGAGALSSENVDLAITNKHAAEYALVEWLNKFGSETANKQFGHVKLIIQNLCQEAFDETESNDKPFGTKMLIQIRKRVREVEQQDRSKLFGLRNPHLMGIVSILTEECKVWWSEKFDLAERNLDEHT